MLKKILLFLLCAAFVVQAARLAAALTFSPSPEFQATKVRLNLARGPFTVYDFSCAGSRPRAVLIFGSGDGGWGGWENRVSQALRRHGYEVIGMDSAAYASTDYDLPTLQADYRTIAVKFLGGYGHNPPPLLVGGWSMGAAQAIAVAGGPHPPPGLEGLLVASPLSRGRYGLRLSDKLNILPTGPGTFAVDGFAPSLRTLPIVQWHGADDTIDSRAWLKDLKDAHRECDLSDAGHDYDNASELFLHRFLGSVAWLLDQSSESRELNARNH
jgi:phosphatidylglycerol lysyltransferase